MTEISDRARRACARVVGDAPRRQPNVRSPWRLRTLWWLPVAFATACGRGESPNARQAPTTGAADRVTTSTPSSDVVTSETPPPALSEAADTVSFFPASRLAEVA